MDDCCPRAMALERDALQEELASVVPAPLARLAVGVASGEAVATSDLLNHTMLARVLGSEPWDRRAVVSVWALEAFETVLPQVVAAVVLLGRVPCVEAAWVIGEGRVTGLRAPAWDEGSFAAFAAGVLRPFVAIVAERGGVSQRVLWSNAGHIVETFLGMLERETGVLAGSAAIRELLAQPVVGGVANGLFAPVRYVNGRRFRRVCCLRFLVPSWRICLICPLPEGHAGRKRGDPPPPGGRA